MKPISSPKLKKFLTDLALGVGKIQLKHFGKLRRIDRKVGAGLVTEADHACEKYALQKVFKIFPESTIITEETGKHQRGNELVWILDPLDGTTNYAHGFPWFCVSIALHEHGKPRAGVIYQPVTKELFYAETGRGATLNGKKIRVSKISAVSDALLGTGFYYTTGDRLAEEVEIFRKVQDKALGVRRPGSAAMDLAYVACGRYDGFWERGLSSWDVAAGMILIEEAGGKVTNYRNEKISIDDGEVVATNGSIHPAILDLIRG
jgi:myo-inositol-1(or 4)-monophosphatase